MNLGNILKDENQSWTSFAIELALLIGMVLFIRYYVFQFFWVSGPSMCPTLNLMEGKCVKEKGEFIFVNEFVYHFEEPKRGDVIVFRPPDKDVHYVKRVIGIPGDVIDIEKGKIYLTSEEDRLTRLELEEPFLSEMNKNRTMSPFIQHFEVPEGSYFLMGDNRAYSLDSRQCFSSEQGCSEETSPYLPKERISGRAEFVVWPFWKIRMIPKDLDDALSDA